MQRRPRAFLVCLLSLCGAGTLLIAAKAQEASGAGQDARQEALERFLRYWRTWPDEQPHLYGRLSYQQHVGERYRGLDQPMGLHGLELDARPPWPAEWAKLAILEQGVVAALPHDGLKLVQTSACIAGLDCRYGGLRIDFQDFLLTPSVDNLGYMHAKAIARERLAVWTRECELPADTVARVQRRVEAMSDLALLRDAMQHAKEEPPANLSLEECLYEALLLHVRPFVGGQASDEPYPCRDITVGDRTVLVFAAADVTKSDVVVFEVFQCGEPRYMVVMHVPALRAPNRPAEAKWSAEACAVARSILAHGLGLAEPRRGADTIPRSSAGCAESEGGSATREPRDHPGARARSGR